MWSSLQKITLAKVFAGSTQTFFLGQSQDRCNIANTMLSQQHFAAAPCSGTSSQTPKRTQHSDSSTLQRHPKLAPCSGTLQRHLAAAPCSGTLQQHQQLSTKVWQQHLAATPCSSTLQQHPAAAPCSGTSNQAPKRNMQLFLILEVRTSIASLSGEIMKPNLSKLWDRRWETRLWQVWFCQIELALYCIIPLC